MKIFLLSQNEASGYDTYSECIVIAEDKESARKIHPSDYISEEEFENDEYGSSTWVSFADIDKINVRELGEANKDFDRGVVCSSFHAG